MLTRNQFLFMLMLSIAGSIFAYALPDIVDWTFKSEFGALLFAAMVALGYVSYIGWQESKRNEELNEMLHEERKAKIAAMLRDHVAKKVAEKRSTDYTDTSS